MAVTCLPLPLPLLIPMNVHPIERVHAVSQLPSLWCTPAMNASSVPVLLHDFSILQQSRFSTAQLLLSSSLISTSSPLNIIVSQYHRLSTPSPLILSHLDIIVSQYHRLSTSSRTKVSWLGVPRFRKMRNAWGLETEPGTHNPLFPIH